MPKLATPVQYEPALEGLNDIRPLQLAEECKIVIPYPVLCKNPPSAGKPAVGKFARCSQQGALLKGNSPWADKIYETELDIAADNDLVSYIFPKAVKAVLAFYEEVMPTEWCRWCDITGEHYFMDISETKWTFLPFVGTNICFKASYRRYFIGIIHIKGFYK